MIQIFISYAREDAEVAQRLSRDLTVAGFLPWLDLEQILPGTRWQVAIKKALRSSRFVLLILSKHSISKRGYIQKEIREALELLDEFPDSEVFLVPVLIEPCEVNHPKLAELQWVELFPSYESGLERIISALHKQAFPDSLSTPSLGKQAILPRSKFASNKVVQFLLVLLLLGISMEAARFLKNPELAEKREPVGEPILSASGTPKLANPGSTIMLSSISDEVGLEAGKDQPTESFNRIWPVRVALANGKSVVVYAWATWCAPCIPQLSVIAGLQKKYDRAVFVGLNYDRPEDQHYAREIADANGLKNLYFAGSYKVLKRLFQTEDEIAFPAFVLFGPKGRLFLRFQGGLSDKEKLEQLEGGLISTRGAVGNS